MKRPSWTESADAAAALLRRAPAAAWVTWAVCTLPFVYLLGRLLLAASFDAYYPEQAGGLTLAVAVAFLFKQVGESYFQGELMRVLGGTVPPLRLGPQLTLQPTALLVLPLAALLFFPLAPAVTFYRTLSVSSPRQALRYATQDVLLQSWELSLAMAGAFLLWVNLFVLWLVTPMLLRAFFGWETAFGRIEERMFNLPSFWVVTLTAYLCVDPLLNAMAARRVFLQEARKTGIDLLAALRMVAAALVLVGPLAAQEAQQVERSIAQTMREPEFAFRQPKVTEPGSEGEGWFLQALRTLARWMEELFEWLRPEKRTPPEIDSFGLSPQTAQNLLIGLGVLLVVALVVYLLRQRRQRPKSAVVAAPAAAPDLNREDLRPDALPEESWLALADEYAGRGEYRLALRALHLAGLRRLSERGLVTIGPAKSGGEYGRELERRGRPLPQVHPLFEANRRRFEEAWYGFHELGTAGVSEVRLRWEEIRQHVG